jgi:hypothetical protein
MVEWKGVLQGVGTTWWSIYDAHQILFLWSALASIGPNKTPLCGQASHHLHHHQGPQSSDYPFNYLLHDRLATPSPIAVVLVRPAHACSSQGHACIKLRRMPAWVARTQGTAWASHAYSSPCFLIYWVCYFLVCIYNAITLPLFQNRDTRYSLLILTSTFVGSLVRHAWFLEEKFSTEISLLNCLLQCKC